MLSLRIIVTGGSGFIGTNLIQLLSTNTSHSIINIDIKPPSNHDHLQFWRSIDILDPDTLTDFISQFCPDVVVNLAARTDLAGKLPRDYAVNYIGLENLCLSLSSCLHPTRLIHASSMLVCKVGYRPRNHSDFCPTTPYGESKVLSERVLTGLPSHINWCIVRPTSIWGPYFSSPYLDFCLRIMAGTYCHFGIRPVLKTYGYVENTVYQIDQLINAPSHSVDNCVFYLGDYEPYNIRNWSDQIASALGLRIASVPSFVILLIALFGSFLSFFGIRFPMTLFRYRNMTTSNLLDLANIRAIAPRLPCSVDIGIERTISWIKSEIS